MGERPLPTTMLPTLGFLVKLLGSPQDGEALGAARAIERKLAGAGLDLHDFAAHVEGHAARAASPPPRQPNPPAWTRRKRAATVYVDLETGRRAALLAALAGALSDTRLRGWSRHDVAVLVDRLNDPAKRPTRNAIERAEAVLAELREAAA